MILYTLTRIILLNCLLIKRKGGSCKMLTVKKCLFIFILYFLATSFAFQPSWAKEASKKTLPDQQKVESTQEKAPPQNQPQISIDSLRYSVGDIYEGEDVIHAFIVKNTGTAELNISKVKAG